jgi:phage terminase large subunit
MAKEILIQLPEKLEPVFSTPNKDYRGARGGRGGAKTIAFANMAIVEIMKPCPKPWRFLCGRELQKSLQDSVFSVIASQIIELGVQNAFEVGKEFIRCKNGNEFLFYGLKSNISEVKGLFGVRRTWLEEAQKVSQSSLTYLIPTVMRDFPDCEIWASWNNEDEEDPIYKLMVTDADERTICVEINYYDNPWFPDSLDRVRLKDKKNNPERYDWIWEGKFNVNALGAVYAEWMHAADKAGRILTDIFDPGLPVYTAWDLGYKDSTAIWWFQICQDEVRLIDFYQAQTKDILHYAEQIHGRKIPENKIKFGLNGKVLSYEFGEVIPDIERRVKYKYACHYLPHDGANKLLQAGGRSTANQLHEFNIPTRVVAATSQQNQIDATRTLIKRCWYDKITCADGIRSMKKYAFKYNESANKWSGEPDHDTGGYSHGCDAHEIIAQVWKSAIIPKSEEKPRFLHQMTINELFESNSSTGSERI